LIVASLVFTIGHGTRRLDELVACLLDAEITTLVDVRRFPGSRRHPHFGRGTLAEALVAAGIVYRHEVDLGGRRPSSPADERFACLQVAAFRSYATWMQTAEWNAGLERALALERPCLMCAETPWWRCHRRLIADALVARGVEVRHLGRRGEAEAHRLFPEAEVRERRLYLCGELVV
jgi:uncharacterized protein (DUF488 family)